MLEHATQRGTCCPTQRRPPRAGSRLQPPPPVARAAQRRGGRHVLVHSFNLRLQWPRQQHGRDTRAEAPVWPRHQRGRGNREAEATERSAGPSETQAQGRAWTPQGWGVCMTRASSGHSVRVGRSGRTRCVQGREFTAESTRQYTPRVQCVQGVQGRDFTAVSTRQYTPRVQCVQGREFTAESTWQREHGREYTAECKRQRVDGTEDQTESKRQTR